MPGATLKYPLLNTRKYPLLNTRKYPLLNTCTYPFLNTCKYPLLNTCNWIDLWPKDSACDFLAPPFAKGGCGGIWGSTPRLPLAPAQAKA